MANTISNIVPQLLVGALPTLREMAVMPRLVNRSIGNEGSDRGDTIDVPIPSAISARDVTPAVTHATNQDMAPSKVQVALDQWKEASFHLSDSDAESVMRGTVPMQAQEAVKALANSVDSYVLGLYKGIYNYGGTAGTTPFATNLNAFKNARTWLNKSLAPMDSRSVVLDEDAEGNALLLDTFLEADKRGDQGGIIRGQIGTKLGCDWYMNQNIKTHTAGSFAIGASAVSTGVIETKAAVSTTANTMIWQANSTTTTVGGSLVVGDLFTVSGHTQTYVVTAAASVAAAAGATLAVQFTPTPESQISANTTITKVATHDVNLVFHRDAFALASRPLAESQLDGVGAAFRSVVDPITGLALRLEISRQYKQTTYSYDVLYGAVLTRANQAARILG